MTLTKTEIAVLLTSIETLRVALPLIALEVPVTAPFDPAAEIFLREAYEAVCRIRDAAYLSPDKDREDVLAAWRTTIEARHALP